LLCYTVDVRLLARISNMVEVTIKLPNSLAAIFGGTAGARSRRLTEDAAIEEYRAGRLSQRQVGEMLELDYWQTERFLAERKVPLTYSVADLEADRLTLEGILASR
jgi:predicted HTH domain antitoxin